MRLNIVWEETKINFLAQLLAISSGNAPSAGGIASVAESAYDTFSDIINIILPIVLGVVLLVGTVYAVILGVNYSKAEDADKRKEAKDRLVGAVVGFGVALVLIAIIYGVLASGLIESLF